MAVAQADASPAHFDYRSGGSASFNQIYTIIADAGRCRTSAQSLA
jgi:hypothetical protein